MKPEWFSLSPPDLENNSVAGKINLPPIPYSQMWETYDIWLPLLISKRKFIGRVDFIQSGAELKPHKWWYSAIAPSGRG
jgi:8-oxo-dGTP diphosphatase / 2-hydroxy-dATP diphosphatase